MKKIPHLPLLIFLCACSPDDPSAPPTSDNDFIIEEHFKPIVTRFFAEADQRGIELIQENLTVELTTASLGDCARGGKILGITSNRTIKIHEEILDRSDLGQEFVLFRELAYVLLNRPYTPKRDHIMNQCNNSAYLEGDRDKRLDELFASNYQTPPVELEANEEQYGAIAMVYEEFTDLEIEIAAISPKIIFTYNSDFDQKCGNSFIKSTSEGDTIELDMSLSDKNGYTLVPYVMREILHLTGRPYSEDEIIDDPELGAQENIMWRCFSSNPTEAEILVLF